MIISKISDGLGNQLFQYASGKALAHKLNTEHKLCLAEYSVNKAFPYGLHHFNIPQNLFKRFPLKRKFCTFFLKNPYYPYKHYKEKSSLYDPDFLNQPDNTCVQGFWQSEKYFKQIRADLLQDLSLKSPLNPSSLKALEQIKSSNSVSVHIRRGDFLTDKDAAKIYVVCDQSYYQPAYEKMKAELESPQFFIFSDDIAWAKENLKFIQPAIFIDDPTRRNYEDLYLMSQCKHNITGNSSFSWWSAWSNPNPNKFIITPAKRFLDSEHPTMTGRIMNTQDLIPESWLQL